MCHEVLVAFTAPHVSPNDCFLPWYFITELDFTDGRADGRREEVMVGERRNHRCRFAGVQMRRKGADGQVNDDDDDHQQGQGEVPMSKDQG